MIPPSQYGVHETHCCIMHGCKYGDDDCPVATGEIKQQYLCEDCPDIFKIGVSSTVNVNERLFTQLFEEKKPYYIFDNKELSLEIGQLLIFNEIDDINKATGRTYIKMIGLVTLGKDDGLPEKFSIATFHSGFGDNF